MIEKVGGICIAPNLFMSGLPLGIGLTTLRAIFEHHNIKPDYFHIVRNKNGEPMLKAFAFVRLMHPSDTDRAIEALHLTIIDGREIYVKLYVDRKHREMARASFHSAPHPTWAAHVAGEAIEAGAR